MKLKLNIERPGVLLVSLFYAVVGVILVLILVLDRFRSPPQVGPLGVLNLMLAYGLLRMKKWSVKLLAAIFLIQVVFGVTTLYYSLLIRTFSSTWETTAFNLSLILFVVLCFISLVYVAAKRKDFK